MKCCASPTISTARSVATSGAGPNRAREAAAQFNALLLGVAFKPLATALGFYGELVVSSASQAVARVERGGLTDRLECLIDAHASLSGSTAKDGATEANAR